MVKFKIEATTVIQHKKDRMEELKVEKKENKNEKRIVSVDVGTMNLCAAHKNDQDQVEISSIRNCYLPLGKDHLSAAELSNVEYVESEDNIYVIGENAFQFANIFGQVVKRPMQHGVISPTDIDSVDVLTLILEQLIGRTKDGICYYSVPANAIDTESTITYHQEVFKRIFNELGYEAVPCNEAMAIIYSECKEEKFSGIGISYGAGMQNIAISFKSANVSAFSVVRGGDWIDKYAAKSLGLVPNKVTSIKEKGIDLINYKEGSKNKRETRIRESIVYYYKEMIRYSIEKILERLGSDLEDLELPEQLVIIVSGGTSKAINFLKLFNTELEPYKKDFPVEIKEVRQAEDPLTAVAEGLLVKALLEHGS
tara:strand:+ start:1865 stop:2968 length:1104 start_codon:yes stop_codon:yes gene_type:complete